MKRIICETIHEKFFHQDLFTIKELRWLIWNCEIRDEVYKYILRPQNACIIQWDGKFYIIWYHNKNNISQPIRIKLVQTDCNIVYLPVLLTANDMPLSLLRIDEPRRYSVDFENHWIQPRWLRAMLWNNQTQKMRQWTGRRYLGCNPRYNGHDCIDCRNEQCN